MARYLILFAVAVVAGSMNAIAGGGTFLTLPSMIVLGVSPILANTTSTFVLWPAGVASAAVYKADLKHPSRLVWALLITSLLGGALGAVVLMRTSDQTFMKVVPWLLLFAVMLFSFSGRIAKSAHGIEHSSAAGLAAIALLQFVIAVYGGFFGAGIGVLMLALFSWALRDSIHSINALRTICASGINCLALIIFLVRNKIDWQVGPLMLVGALIGGYGCAYFVRKLRPATARAIAVALAWTMTVAFFVKRYAVG